MRRRRRNERRGKREREREKEREKERERERGVGWHTVNRQENGQRASLNLKKVEESFLGRHGRRGSPPDRSSQSSTSV